MKIAVYSCVTGGYDDVQNTLARGATTPEPGVSYYLFTDKLTNNFQTPNGIEWQVLELQYQHGLCRRRTARWHKLASHELFPSHDATLWLDASQRFKGIDVRNTVETAIGSKDLATFKHPDRTCVYQELQACILLQKDNASLMRKQVNRYRSEKYPPFRGLVETACLIRRNSKEVADFNKAWWQELNANSLRDQLSFNYVAWRLNFSYGFIPGCQRKSPLFDFVPHT